jgi:hypothetical protein
MKGNLMPKLTSDEREAVKRFATLGISVDDFLARMSRLVHVGSFMGGEREIEVSAMPGEDVVVTRDDVRRVLQRYLHGKSSGEEVSHWAGLLLALPVYALPSADSDDDVLALLTDLALPLKEDYLDRDKLKYRMATI